MTAIEFPDVRARDDFNTFVLRARKVRPLGDIRLQTIDGLLLMTVAVLEGSGLMGEGTVLGMRVVPARATEPVDVTVSFASVRDRLARSGAAPTSFDVPPTTVNAPWAALSPPRSGWESAGTLDPADVDRIAARGIEVVAAGTPPGAGTHAVKALRQRVWGELSETDPAIPAGLAFAAHALGFTRPGEPVVVARHGDWDWIRLSTSLGHCIAR
jgi:hypothetical protein